MSRTYQLFSQVQLLVLWPFFPSNKSNWPSSVFQGRAITHFWIHPCVCVHLSVCLTHWFMFDQPAWNPLQVSSSLCSGYCLDPLTGFSLIPSNTSSKACKPLQRGAEWRGTFAISLQSCSLFFIVYIHIIKYICISLYYIGMAPSPVGFFGTRPWCPRGIHWLKWKKEVLCSFIVMYELKKPNCYCSSLIYLPLSKDCWSCCLQRLHDLSHQLSHLSQRGTPAPAVLQPVRISPHHHPAHTQTGECKWDGSCCFGLCQPLVPGAISLYFSGDFCGIFSSNSVAICGCTVMFSPPLWVFFPSLQRLLSAGVGEEEVARAVWGLCFWVLWCVCAVCSTLGWSAAFSPGCSIARIYLWVLLFDLGPHWDNRGVCWFDVSGMEKSSGSEVLRGGIAASLTHLQPWMATARKDLNS